MVNMKVVTRKFMRLYWPTKSFLDMKAGSTKLYLLKQRNFQISVLISVFDGTTIASGGRSLFSEAGIATRGNIVPIGVLPKWRTLIENLCGK